jgi:hypothetical protein
VVKNHHVPFTGCVDRYAAISPRKVAGPLDRGGNYAYLEAEKPVCPLADGPVSMMLDLDFLVRDARGTGSDRNQSLRVACKETGLKIVDRGSFDGDPALDLWKFHSRDPD